MRFLLAVAAVVLSAIAAAAAQAQPWSDPGLGVGIQAGYSKGADAAESVPVARVHIRYRMTGMLGVEAAAGYRQEEMLASGERFLRVSGAHLTGSFLLFLLYDHPVQPFLLGGGGYYYVSERGLGAIQDYRRTEHLFGFHAGGGVDARVSKRLSFFADARFTFLRLGSIDPFYDGKADFLSTTAGVNLYF